MLRTSKALNKLQWLWILLPLFGHAQGNEAYQLDSQNMNRHAVSLIANGNYGANSFTPGSVASLYFSGIIDDATLTDLAETAMVTNKIYYRDELHLMYERPFKDQMALRIGFTQRNFVSLVTPRTALEFAAYGNGPYKGSEVVVDELGLDFFTTSGITLGFSRIFDLSTGKLKVDVNAGLLQGQNLVNINVKNSSLFTEENAEYIDIVYDYDYNFYDNSKAFSGLGFDFGFRVAYRHQQRFKLESWVEGLGNMYWSGDELNSGSAAGEINYSGLFFTFDELSTIGSNNELDREVDSLQALMSPTKRDNYTLNLPYTVGLNFSTYFGKSESITVGAHMVPGFYQLPVVDVSFRHFATDKIYSALNYNSGPFGGHAFGLEVGYFHDKFSFEAKVNSPFRVSDTRTPLTGGRIKLSYFI